MKTLPFLIGNTRENMFGVLDDSFTWECCTDPGRTSDLCGVRYLLAAGEIHAQITIQERMELGTNSRSSTAADTIEPFERFHLFLGNGGDVRLHFGRNDRYNLDNWALYEKEPGKIADVPDVNNLDLGNFPQWTGFSFYLVNKEDGRKKYPEDAGETSCNAQFPRFIDQTVTFVDLGHHLNLHLEPDSSQVAKPSRRIMNCVNANPFSPGGAVTFNEDRLVYYRIKGVRSNANIDLHLERPHETPLMEDIGTRVGEFERIGHIPAGDSIRF